MQPNPQNVLRIISHIQPKTRDWWVEQHIGPSPQPNWSCRPVHLILWHGEPVWKDPSTNPTKSAWACKLGPMDPVDSLVMSLWLELGNGLLSELKPILWIRLHHHMMRINFHELIKIKTIYDWTLVIKPMGCGRTDKWAEGQIWLQTVPIDLIKVNDMGCFWEIKKRREFSANFWKSTQICSHMQSTLNQWVGAQMQINQSKKSTYRVPQKSTAG